MKSFEYTLCGSTPIPLAGLSRLISIADCYPDTTCIVENGNRRADISRPIKLAALGLRKGDAITVSVEGPSEVEMFDVLCQFFAPAV